MRAAEVFLRMGSGLVAWMLVYAYILWLSVLHIAGCADGDQLHRVLLAAAVLAAAASPLLSVTAAFREVHRMLRWLAAPLVLLLPFAVRNVWGVFERVLVNGLDVCGDTAAARWQYAWAPAQILMLLLLCFTIWRAWRACGYRNNALHL